MLKNIRSQITGKWVLVLFVAANAVYLSMLLYSIPTLQQYSGGLPIFDMSPMGYSYQEALKLLTALGEDGRSLYLSLQLSLDVFYPILFALCYFALLQWLITLGQLTNRFWSLVSAIPLLVCLSDYAENICIWLMIRDYPVVSEKLVSTSSTFTMIKSISTTVYFSGLILVLVLLMVRRLVNRSSTKAS